MADGTGISWTDATWNPVRGCSRVSEGCRNCYAERVAARFSGPGQPYEGLVRVRSAVSGLIYKSKAGAGSYVDPRWNGTVRMVPEHLGDPMRWKRPRRIFVNSMSDLFHEGLTNEQIAAVFGVMAAAPRHTFQVLTKRARRMREWFAWIAAQRTRLLTIPVSPRLVCRSHAAAFVPTMTLGTEPQPRQWPLPNVWLGVSVEDQAAADERIPELLRTPAAVRFLSCEPLLGPVNLRHLDDDAAGGAWCQVDGLTGNQTDMGRPCPPVGARVDWVIAGCESGPGARPCGVEWLRSLRWQCAAARVPFFLKQASQPGSEAVGGPLITPGPGSKRKAGGVIELPYLDGVQHAAFPEVA
jgi:protein gp37